MVSLPFLSAMGQRWRNESRYAHSIHLGDVELGVFETASTIIWATGTLLSS
jgi:hypothetical protein